MTDIKVVKLGAAAPPAPETEAVAAAAAAPPSGLSEEQEYVIQKFHKGDNLFITGAGGTGKSHLLRQIVREAAAAGKKAQVCALTGRAAVLLNCRAKTIHSWSGIRLAKGPRDKIVEQAIKKLNMLVRRKSSAAHWRNTETLIIDEVSMMSRKVFEVLDQIGRIVRKRPHAPFGGMQILFFGDFFQLAPTPDHGDEPATGEYCFESPLWQECFSPQNHIKLTKIFRQNDETFIKILSQIREGRISKRQHELLQTRLNAEPPVDIQPTKLFPLRASAATVNNNMFEQLPDPEVNFPHRQTFTATTYMDKQTPIEPELIKETKQLPEDQKAMELLSLFENSPVQQNLALKIGAQVMLCYNLNVEEGLCNGSLGIVIGFSNPEDAVTGGGGIGFIDSPERLPIVRFLNGRVAKIAPVAYQSANFPPIVFWQIPLKLAWALTIHSSQGATLDAAQIDIGSGIFAVGQTYVALSRVKSLDGLYLTSYDPSKIKVSQKVIDFYRTF